MNVEELKKIEHLCNIKVEEENRERLAKQLTEIIDNIRRMYEIDISGIKMYRPSEIRVSSLREDSVCAFEDVESILNNAANREGDFIVVPKIIGGER